MTEFYNRTRITSSIPRKLVREGKFHLLPLYYLVRLSDLGREGIENSGSYRFADHIYAGKATGRFGIGRLIDAVLMRLKSAKSMRARHINAKKEAMRFIDARRGSRATVDILTAPCGLARELFELSDELSTAGDKFMPPVRFHGFDLDAELINGLKRRDGDISFWVGDALEPDSYRHRFDVIISNGFTDFLNDEQTVRFYRLAARHLKPGGRLVTSGMRPHPVSDYLMRNLAELMATYRSERELRALARSAGFHQIVSYQNRYKLQTMMIGVKHEYS